MYWKLIGFLVILIPMFIGMFIVGLILESPIFIVGLIGAITSFLVGVFAAKRRYSLLARNEYTEKELEAIDLRILILSADPILTDFFLMTEIFQHTIDMKSAYTNLSKNQYSDLCIMFEAYNSMKEPVEITMETLEIIVNNIMIFTDMIVPAYKLFRISSPSLKQTLYDIYEPMERFKRPYREKASRLLSDGKFLSQEWNELADEFNKTFQGLSADE